MLRERFDTKDDAILWLKNQKPGEYALFTWDDASGSFVPVKRKEY